MTPAIALIVCTQCFLANVSTMPDPYGGINQCGFYSLQMAVAALGMEAPAVIPEEWNSEGELVDLNALRLAAESWGMSTRALRYHQLRMRDFPVGKSAAIIQVVTSTGQTHFVAVLEANNKDVLIADFPHAPFWYSQTDLKTRSGWNGVVLHLAKAHNDLPIADSFVSRALGWTLLSIPVAIAVMMGCRRWSRRRSRPACRQAFTLIELLVVLTLISLLISLLMPAVQAARESARRTQCRSQLRQFGLAIANYESTYGRLPPAYPQFVNLTGPRRFVPRNLSVHARLLPYLDQAAAYNRLDQSEDGATAASEPPHSALNSWAMRLRLPVLLCPSDPRSETPGTSIRVCFGSTPGIHNEPAQPSYRGAYAGAFSPQGKPLSAITDGLSYTAFAAEKLLGDQDSGEFTAWSDTAIMPGLPTMLPDEAATGCGAVTANPVAHYSFGGASWLYSGYSQTWYNHVLLPNARIPDCAGGINPSLMSWGAHTARSLHAGGAHVLSGDGAIRFVSDSVDLAPWREFATIDTGVTPDGL